MKCFSNEIISTAMCMWSMSWNIAVLLHLLCSYNLYIFIVLERVDEKIGLSPFFLKTVSLSDETKLLKRNLPDSAFEILQLNAG